MPFDVTPITSPVIENLKEGRARIRRGWCQGSAHDPNANAYCLIGSISSPREAVMRFLAEAAGSLVGSLVIWNDTPGRTQADVVDLYDRAIKIAVDEELARVNAA